MENSTAEILVHDLQKLTGLRIELTLTYNKTRMISFKKKWRTIFLRLNENIFPIEEDFTKSLALWIKNPNGKVPLPIRERINQVCSELPPREKERKIVEKHSGKYFDLKELYDKINLEYFNGSIESKISWGRDTSKKRVKSRRLGSYKFRTNLIVIHPILDNKNVPIWMVEFIIYHEMLHSLQQQDKKRYHDREFRESEKLHSDYERAVKWRKDNAKYLFNGSK
jgi:predicted SprT family Zn-dependent metalloprotease